MNNVFTCTMHTGNDRPYPFYETIENIVKYFRKT